MCIIWYKFWLFWFTSYECRPIVTPAILTSWPGLSMKTNISLIVKAHLKLSHDRCNLDKRSHRCNVKIVQPIGLFKNPLKSFQVLVPRRGYSRQNRIRGCACQTSKIWLSLYQFAQLPTHQFTIFDRKAPNFMSMAILRHCETPLWIARVPYGDYV